MAPNYTNTSPSWKGLKMTAWKGYSMEGVKDDSMEGVSMEGVKDDGMEGVKEGKGTT